MERVDGNPDLFGWFRIGNIYLSYIELSLSILFLFYGTCNAQNLGLILTCVMPQSSRLMFVTDILVTGERLILIIEKQ